MDRKFKRDFPLSPFYQICSLKSIFSQIWSKKRKTGCLFTRKIIQFPRSKKAVLVKPSFERSTLPQSLLIHGGLKPSSPAFTNPLIICGSAGFLFPVERYLSFDCGNRMLFRVKRHLVFLFLDYF